MFCYLKSDCQMRKKKMVKKRQVRNSLYFQPKIFNEDEAFPFRVNSSLCDNINVISNPEYISHYVFIIALCDY